MRFLRSAAIEKTERLTKAGNVLLDFGAGTGGLSELRIRASTLKYGFRIPYSVTLIDVDPIPLATILFGVRLRRLPPIHRIRLKAEPVDGDPLSKQLAEAVNSVIRNRFSNVDLLGKPFRSRLGQLTDAVFLRRLWETGKLEIVIDDVRHRLQKSFRSQARKRYKVGTIALIDPPRADRKSVYRSIGSGADDRFAYDVIRELIRHEAAVIVHVDSVVGHNAVAGILTENGFQLAGQYRIFFVIQFPGDPNDKPYSDTRDHSRYPYIRFRVNEKYANLSVSDDPSRRPKKASVLGSEIKLPTYKWRPASEDIKSYRKHLRQLT